MKARAVSGFRVKLKRDEVGKFMRSDVMQADMERRGRQIAAKAGEGFVAEKTRGKRARASCTVLPTTRAARKAQAERNVLIRSLDAGRN